MRLSLAVPILAGLLFGWTAIAQADAPPAAPIFYCPTPGKADPAPAATAPKPAAHAGHAIRASTHRHRGCPTQRVAAEHHRWHGHAAAPPRAVASNDVSASQAFIYRYERALHGLDARAADQAWAEGRHPPCPHGPADHCPDRWRHDGPPMGPALAQRQIPPPPCPHGCPGPEAWRHQPDDRAYAQAPPPPAEERPLPPPMMHAPPPPPVPAPPPPPRAYAWQDDHSGYRYDEREQESERAGGWRYSEVGGRGHYQHWGDRFDGEPGWDGRDDGRRDDGQRERHWAAPLYRCPPPVPASSCAAGPDAPVRHSDVDVAGRDAAGYLTWPGKTE